MASEKASFYSRDLAPVSSGTTKDPKAKKYMGVERRRDDRRKAQDRRDDVRFDLKSSDRRQADGRREGDVVPKFW